MQRPEECPNCGSTHHIHYVVGADGVTCHYQCGLFPGEHYSGCDWKSETFRAEKSSRIASSGPWGDEANHNPEGICNDRVHKLCPDCGPGADHCSCRCPGNKEEQACVYCGTPLSKEDEGLISDDGPYCLACDNPDKSFF